MHNKTLCPIVDPDLSQFTGSLAFLVAVPTDPNLPTFIGHWTPPDARARHVHIYTQLQAAQIELLQDHKSYGVVTIPCAGVDLPRFLHSQIVGLHTHSADPDMVSKLSTRFRGQEASSATETSLFIINILYNEDDGWLTPDTRLIWKWAKPQSAYRTSGFWETTLDKVIVDGEWAANKGLMILVRSVDDAEFGRIKRGRVK